jgi:N-acetylmuramoyl-L-alanine amidase
MPIVGRITLDGIPIGVIQVNLTEGDVATYPPGLDFGPREEPEGAPFGPGSPRGPGAHTGPPPEHGPTFRHGTGPGSKSVSKGAKPEHYATEDIHKALEGTKPEHYTTEDIHKALVEGKAGAPDRSAIAKELEDNEALKYRYAQMVVGEINYDRASERAKLVQAETAANRALKRGHSLEQALWLHGHGIDRLGGVGHGGAGYYPMTTMNRGITDAQYEDFKTNILPKVLAGSDEAMGFTGNASAGIASRQRARGTPYLDLRGEGGDQYFDEDVGKTLPRRTDVPVGVTEISGKPLGVTRLPRGYTTPVTADKIAAASGGEPAAFIFHHTGGGGSVSGVQNTLRQRGLGVEYVMDREGDIYRTGNPGAAHIMPGSGVGAGLSNRNTYGMEVIARNDRDVTPAQIAAAKKFIAKNYPNTPVFGHGEVNPGHKEATEGMSIVNAIRNQRATPTKTAGDSAGDNSKGE